MTTNIITNNINNHGIQSFIDMIARHPAETIIAIVGFILGITIVDKLVRIAVDIAFEIYDYYTDPFILRQRKAKNNNNNNKNQKNKNSIRDDDEDYDEDYDGWIIGSSRSITSGNINGNDKRINSNNNSSSSSSSNGKEESNNISSSNSNGKKEASKLSEIYWLFVNASNQNQSSNDIIDSSEIESHRISNTIGYSNNSINQGGRGISDCKREFGSSNHSITNSRNSNVNGNGIGNPRDSYHIAERYTEDTCAKHRIHSRPPLYRPPSRRTSSILVHDSATAITTPPTTLVEDLRNVDTMDWELLRDSCKRKAGETDFKLNDDDYCSPEKKRARFDAPIINVNENGSNIDAPSTPVRSPDLASHKIEEYNDEDDDSCSDDYYFRFILPSDFMVSHCGNKRGDEEDVVSLTYSEESIVDDDSTSLMGETIVVDKDDDEENAADDNSFGTAEDSIMVAELRVQEEDEEDLVQLGQVSVDDASAHITSQPELVNNDTAEITLVEVALVNKQQENEEDAFVVAVPQQLGSIWVKHPELGCIVRRSIRIILMSKSK